jgi:dTDP-4-dehydrorhamnose reductase
MNILIFGKDGQLGKAFKAVFDASKLDELHRITYVGRAECDLSNADAISVLLDELKPNLIMNAAAYTAVDKAETEVDLAYAINAKAPEIMAQYAVANGASLLHYSTDYVFDGTKPTPYNEDDVPNPQSVYGASKLAGERAMGADDAIVRISWVCGFHGANMVKTILKLGATMPELKFVDDQIGNPTFADDAARAIVDIATSGLGGIWHVTNQGVVSWYEFAREVLLTAGMDAQKVKPISTRDLQPPRPAQRPANSVLHDGRLGQAGIAVLPDFREPLARLVRRLLAETGE